MSRKTRSFVAGLAMAVFAVNAFAAPAVKAQAKTAAKTAAKAETHALSGALEKYDASTNTITITASSGAPQTLTLAPNAQVRNGKETLAAKDLTGEVGHQVRVQYTEAGGQKMAQSVAIQAGASTKRASNTAKK